MKMIKIMVAMMTMSMEITIVDNNDNNYDDN